MHAIISLLACSLSVATAWRNPFYEYKSYQVSPRQSDPTAYVFLCNCWASPGARSEVDFFTNYPTNFGNATPEFASVLTPNNNYVWQNGGSTRGPEGDIFRWTITNRNAATNAQAGNATSGDNKYIVLKDTESTLYQPVSGSQKFNCIVVYRCQLDNSASTPPSTNSTTSSSSSSSSSSTTSGPTSSPTAGPATSPTPSPTNTSNSGTSSSTQLGIGLGVGLGLGLPLIALAAFFLWRRRRRGTSGNEPIGVYPDEKKTQFPPTSGAAAGIPPHQGGGYMASELQNNHLSEMPGVARPVEFDAQGQTINRYQQVPHSPVEMDAGGRYTPH